MELNLTSQLKRASETSRPAAQKTGKNAPAPQSIRAKSASDRVAVSQAALKFLEEQTKRQQEEMVRRRKDQAQGMYDSGENSYESSLLEGLDKQMDIQRKCMKISVNIMSGNKVPPEDMEYLMKHDINGYKLAMAMRKPKKNPKELKSVLTDEDRKAEESTVAQETASVSSSPAPAAECDCSGGGSGGEAGGDAP